MMKINVFKFQVFAVFTLCYTVCRSLPVRVEVAFFILVCRQTEVAANKVNVCVETAENISFDNEWILKINGREFNTNYIF